MPVQIPVLEKIMDANDQLAAQNKALLDSHGVFMMNIMASPGAGKTSVILKTIEQLAFTMRLAVIEGDTAPVTIDADKVSALGIPAVQINTGGDCHLDAIMVGIGLSKLPLADLDLIIIENVGNLVCPAAFNLGSHTSVLIASVPEGDDKPYKYPNIYRGLDALILNKMDLLPYIKFDPDYFFRGVAMLNPDVQRFQVSCTTGQGIQEWTDWITKKVHNHKK
ncbi:MAG: hydrogenase nickel incorporation protein HypB [Anaerolineaceae bacterium]